MPRRRGMSMHLSTSSNRMGASLPRSSVKIMSPREWTIEEEGSAKAVKWTEFSSPRHTESMIFAFPHVFNLELGGECTLSSLPPLPSTSLSTLKST